MFMVVIAIVIRLLGVREIRRSGSARLPPSTQRSINHGEWSSGSPTSLIVSSMMPLLRLNWQLKK